jgi:hypothetical protein
VRASFFQIRETYSRIPTAVVVTGFFLTAISNADEPPRGVLSQFLAGQIAPETLEFGEIRMTRAHISDWLGKLRTAHRPEERAVAVANLQNCAWVLLDVPAATPAALELLDQWVLPNVTLLRGKPRTSACSWENVVQGAYASYKRAGDLHGERRVLELLSTQARDPGLRDLAMLRLAGMKATQGSLKGAIDIARKANPRGKFAEPRAKLLESWQQEIKSKKTRP